MRLEFITFYKTQRLHSLQPFNGVIALFFLLIVITDLVITDSFLPETWLRMEKVQKLFNLSAVSGNDTVIKKD